MATQAQYDAAVKAALTIAHADVKADVPVFIQPEIPMDVLDREVTRIAKAAVDAAEGAK